MFEDSRVVDPTAVFPALAAAIAAIPVRPERSEPSAAVTGEARALLVLRRQLEARLLGRVAAIDELQLVVPEGFANTAAWLRGYANLDPAPATALVRAARIGETLPGLAGLVAQGKVGPEHLNAVAAGAHRVPARLLADHETTLVTL